MILQKSQYNNKVTNDNCKLVNKLAEADRKIEEYEKKIKDLEFCLEECKLANGKMTDIVKRTNLVKQQMKDMLLIKDKKDKMVIVDGKIQVYKKVDGVKCYELIRLLGQEGKNERYFYIINNNSCDSWSIRYSSYHS